MWIRLKAWLGRKHSLLKVRDAYIECSRIAYSEVICLDIHPEMLQLQTELDKRRNKRLDLAARRRDFEVANVVKRRRLDEAGVWSWWQVRYPYARDISTYSIVPLLRVACPLRLLGTTFRQR